MKLNSPRLSVRSGLRSGFTLLEILVALAIVGLLMVAMNTFMFSMGELWGRNSESHLFTEHVNAVTHFLQDQFNAATFPPASRPYSSPIAPMSVTPLNGLQDNLVSFELTNGCRILNWPGRPLPEVVCSLQVRQNDGLYMLWMSRLEMNFGTAPPRETRISPLVTNMAYDYYDDTLKRWTTETVLRTDSTGNLQTPNRLRLTFAYGKLVPKIVLVTIPDTLAGVPNY